MTATHVRTVQTGADEEIVLFRWYFVIFLVTAIRFFLSLGMPLETLRNSEVSLVYHTGWISMVSASPF